MRYTVVLSTALALSAGCALAGGADDPLPALAPGEAIVVRVVDGDTVGVEVAGAEESIRLIGIDTPETVDPRRGDECFGQQASEHTKDLLPEGTRVRLERDVELRDRYGRLLAYVFRADDGLFVNEALAADGYAQALTVAPNLAYQQRFQRAVASARAAGKGLWSACEGDSVPP